MFYPFLLRCTLLDWFPRFARLTLGLLFTRSLSSTRWMSRPPDNSFGWKVLQVGVQASSDTSFDCKVLQVKVQASFDTSFELEGPSGRCADLAYQLWMEGPSGGGPYLL